MTACLILKYEYCLNELFSIPLILKSSALYCTRNISFFRMKYISMFHKFYVGFKSGPYGGQELNQNLIEVHVASGMNTCVSCINENLSYAIWPTNSKNWSCHSPNRLHKCSGSFQVILPQIYAGTTKTDALLQKWSRSSASIIKFWFQL